MSRKRKAKEIEAEEPQADVSEDEVDDGSNGLGHNGPPAEMTEEQRMALFFQHKKSYENALAVKKAADSAFKLTCKTAKAELGKDAVAEIKDAILLETPEGEDEFKARAERQMRVARYMGAAIGSQFDIFDTSGVPATERAQDEGKRSGMAGEPLNPPYDKSVPQYDAFSEGWYAGQRVLFSIQRKEDDAEFETAGEPAGEADAEQAAAAA